MSHGHLAADDGAEAAACSPPERRAMVRAIDLARSALGQTNPNPVVGAVVLAADGSVVAEGRHAVAGGQHAEVVALAAAGESARGATLVVTLEPCRHVGRTGACTDAVLAAGIRRVVYAVSDPSAGAGGGAAVLRAAGVDVVGDLLAAEASVANSDWLTAVGRARPHVTWKYAATLDGRSAAADGSSRWVTGPAARRDVHALRLAADAVVVGVGTVLADDPALTVRDVPATRQPLRVVADSLARTPVTAAVTAPDAATIVAVTDRADRDRVAALRDAGVEVVVLASPDGRVDPAALLAELSRRGLFRLLVEGGPRLAASLLRAGLVDRVVAYLAPALLGAGPTTVADLGIATIADALRLRMTDVAPLDGDLRVTAELDAAPTKETG